MFFSAYVGAQPGFSLWCGAVREHARWLGLTADVESRPLRDGRSFAAAWMTSAPGGTVPRLREVDGTLLATTREADGSGNVASLTLSVDRGELCVALPPAGPEQVYYARLADGDILADDLRLFPRVMDAELDRRAVYALLHYGAIPAPLTIWQEVGRIPSGQVLRLSPRHREPRCEPVFRFGDHGGASATASDADALVRTELDASLSRIPPGAVLYFSGGVDSGLLASRLVRAGRKDVRLFNYAFGPEDSESELALDMASHLGLECRRVTHEPGKVAEVLERLGRDYSFPFGDLSTIPMNILVHASLPAATESGVVVEGTGADGAFGIAERYPLWRGVFGVPVSLRRQVDRAYGTLRLWEQDSLLERAARFVRKSARLPLAQAVVAQNALDGLAYPVPPGARAAVDLAVATGIDALSRGGEAEERLALVDLVWVCAGRMAPKSFDPLRTRGVRPLYPFLEPGMLRVSSSLPWREKCPRGAAKVILKRLLATDVPHEWVYRPKRGFTPPYREMFASAPLQEFLHEVVLADDRLLASCDPDRVRHMVRQTRGPRPLSSGAYEFLWALTFTAGWLAQQPTGERREPAEASFAEEAR
jgi:asparagine synthase (glutamine-hydrolysing)